MKKTLSILLALTMCLAMFAGCQTQAPTTGEETTGKVISPLPETLDINNLEDCMVRVSLEQGDAYVDDNGKMQMNVTVYSYELYDMIDISELAEGDTIMRQGEAVTVNTVERLDSGLVRINGGEEQGGFDLTSDDTTVYHEVGMDDAKAYYALGEVTLPVSTEFLYTDASDVEGEATKYYPGDFLTDAAGITYDFAPENTTIVIEDGVVFAMNKIYNP